ncbi:zinc knuckle CX2CX4HX4C containing protein [Tanacetum coccineum]
MPIRVLRNPNLETMSDGNVHTQSLNEDKTVKIMGVPLNTLRDIDNLTKAIDLGKLEVWSDLPSEKHTEVMETIWAMWDAFLTENPNVTSGYSSDSGKSDVVIGIERGTYEVWSKLTCKQRKAILKTAHDRWNALLELESAGLGISMITVPSLVSPCEPIVKTIDTHENSDPIVQSVDINNMPTSYAGAAAPIILKKWSTDTKLLKEELTRIPIWFKLHDVPLQVFEDDGISLIASFIGKLVMLDSYTSSMCNDSWGRSSFAWCLIDVKYEADLVEAVTIGIPLLTGKDFTNETIRVEYEWRPPRCDECKIFGHVHDQCPKKVVSPPIVATPNVVNTSNVVTPTVKNDGFQAVGKKKKKKSKPKTSNSGQFVGPLIHQNFRYEPKASTSAPKKVANVGNVSISSSLLKNKVTSSHQDNITSSNSFSALNVEDEKEEEEVENVSDETANIFNTKTGGRSSFTAVVS